MFIIMTSKQNKEIINESIQKQIEELNSVLFLDDFISEIECHLIKCWSFKEISKSEKQQKYLVVRAKQLNTIRQNLMELKEIVAFLMQEDVYKQAKTIYNLKNVLSNFDALKKQSALRGDKEMYRKLYHIDVLPQQFIDEYNIADELKK